MTIAQALAAAAALGLERLDAQLLLLHVVQREDEGRAWLLAHDDDALDLAAHEAFMGSCRRRTAGEPLAYIVGHKEFFGLRLAVDQRVLVPRPDTETLVEWALAVIRGQARDDNPSVIDLGTGSGAIALAIKKHCPQASVEAIDASEGALEVAAANSRALSLDVAFRRSCWLAEAGGRYDLIVSNPPYVAATDPHLGALTHEPLAALASGPDGLDDIRAIATQAPAHLRPGGWLLLEHGWDQAPAVRQLLAAAGFRSVASRKDLAGIERCSGGQWLELG
ncbi:peptide chain release factor N(5)-glutamine methyltransferase [Ramlibacter sp. WS9]|uniref:peptide chain release factor N(5)-glutamine methyltransferase n=1 Tax=Ramlibacter sp. WS9 TaxID=1882741 RepID=UPI001143AD9C|nr:peptide chain release factor N(5)-glutamine methyltransferase [Ramlibacter sp. WS9]ROZ72729.1 peptide chain release factor N(5)-glutamine methyltransferase [Ramlibacter sp. WS9]